MSAAHHSHIDLNQLAAYVGSPPKAPLDLGTAEFIKGKPAITQLAKDWRYYESTLIQHEEAGAALYLEYKESGAWKAHYKTWGAACVPLGKSRRQIDRLIQAEADIRTECPEVMHVDSNIQTTNALPTMADIDADLVASLKPKEPEERPAVHAGPAPRPEPEPHAKPADPYRDLIGFPIPASLRERWNQRQEVQDRITAASRLRCALEEIANKGHQNPLYGAYDWQGMIRTIGQLQFHLGMCKPEVVCYECDGDYLKVKSTKGGDGITRHCHCCNDRGFLTQKQWDDYADSKLEVIQKRVKARLAKCKEG